MILISPIIFNIVLNNSLLNIPFKHKPEKEWTLEDKKELNEYVAKHVERYENLYQSVLANFGFEVKFINH